MTNTRDASYLSRAVSVAQQSTCRQRHGAVLVRGRKVLAVAVNRFRNYPWNVTDPKRESSVHAEVAVLKAVRGEVDLSECVLYVARVGKNNEPMMSKPCALCDAWLDALGVRRVVWTT